MEAPECDVICSGVQLHTVGQASAQVSAANSMQIVCLGQLGAKELFKGTVNEELGFKFY